MSAAAKSQLWVITRIPLLGCNVCFRRAFRCIGFQTARRRGFRARRGSYSFRSRMVRSGSYISVILRLARSYS
jgi:hypothetical protein